MNRLDGTGEDWKTCPCPLAQPSHTQTAGIYTISDILRLLSPSHIFVCLPPLYAHSPFSSPLTRVSRTRHGGHCCYGLPGSAGDLAENRLPLRLAASARTSSFPGKTQIHESFDCKTFS
jgi:hypothetical protein